MNATQAAQNNVTRRGQEKRRKKAIGIAQVGAAVARQFEITSRHETTRVAHCSTLANRHSRTHISALFFRF